MNAIWKLGLAAAGLLALGGCAGGVTTHQFVWPAYSELNALALTNSVVPVAVVGTPPGGDAQAYVAALRNPGLLGGGGYASIPYAGAEKRGDHLVWVFSSGNIISAFTACAGGAQGDATGEATRIHGYYCRFDKPMTQASLKTPAPLAVESPEFPSTTRRFLLSLFPRSSFGVSFSPSTNLN